MASFKNKSCVMYNLGYIMSDIVKKSKFLSLVLRHKPEEIGLTLDSSGWARIDELCRLSCISQNELGEVVATNNKKRFEYNENKTKIRACQGHSININLNLPSSTPPEILYHGTATRFLDSIFYSGIVAKGRDMVHLSTNIETAKNVGSRHGNPIVLSIRSGDMLKDGFKFYVSNNGVWLTESVPSKYIEELS